MKLQQICTQILLCALVFLNATPLTTMQQGAAPTPLPVASATVADLKGEVQVELPGRGDALPTLGQVLPPETVVTTKEGSVLLRLEDGSQILVHSKTRLVLKQPSPTGWQRLLLSLGKIKAEIPQPRRLDRGPGGEQSLNDAAELIAQAKFPVIISGGGVVMADAIEECKALAERLGAPVVNSYLHNDSFPANHPLWCGPLR